MLMKKSIISCVLLFFLSTIGRFAIAQTVIGCNYLLPICRTQYHEFGDKFRGFPLSGQELNGNSWARGNGATLFIEKRISKAAFNAGVGFVQNNMRIDVSGYSVLKFYYKPLVLKRNFLLSELNCTWPVLNRKNTFNVGFGYRFICNYWDPFYLDTLQLTAYPRKQYESTRELLPVYFTKQSYYVDNHIFGIIANYNKAITSSRLTIRLGLGLYSGIKSQWFTSAFKSSSTSYFIESKYHVTNGPAVEFKVSLIHELSKKNKK
jgi:hypothetical protein